MLLFELPEMVFHRTDKLLQRERLKPWPKLLIMLLSSIRLEVTPSRKKVSELLVALPLIVFPEKKWPEPEET